uniref:DUF4939 domain-containing protein n=1 Tax=Xiphophorus maculatus TaxID=8083 RepID=A0A3B5R6K4_XIPMA
MVPAYLELLLLGFVPQILTLLVSLFPATLVWSYLVISRPRDGILTALSLTCPSSATANTVHSTVSDFRPSLPERFSGEASKFKGFWFQCSIIFNHSPQSFSQDGRKISFILSHLSGKALEWAEAKYSSTVDYGCTFDEFIKEFKQAFNQDTDKTADSRGLLEIKQGNRTVADFAIEFRIKAAASGWGQTASSPGPILPPEQVYPQPPPNVKFPGS